MGRFPHYLIIVRDGETQLFEDLKAQLAREPYPAALIWDRRQGDGRARAEADGPDRRADERRAPPDPTLETDGFIVTVTAEPPAEAIRNELASVTPSRDGAAPPSDRGATIFALRMFALNLRSKLRELRARRATARPQRRAPGGS